MTELVVDLGSRFWGFANRPGSSIQGFTVTEKVIRAAGLGSPSNCHPGLDPGSGSKNEQRRTGFLGGGPLTGNMVFIIVQGSCKGSRSQTSFSLFLASSRERQRHFLSNSLTSPDAFPGITSWDVLPSITSLEACRHCVI